MKERAYARAAGIRPPVFSRYSRSILTKADIQGKYHYIRPVRKLQNRHSRKSGNLDAKGCTCSSGFLPTQKCRFPNNSITIQYPQSSFHYEFTAANQRCFDASFLSLRQSSLRGFRQKCVPFCRLFAAFRSAILANAARQSH